MNQLSTRLFPLFLTVIVVLMLAGSFTAGVGQVSTAQARPLAAPAAQQFAISIGDTVSDGVPAPGAGNIEVPGAVDIYTFVAVAGQEAVFDLLSGNPVLLGWQLQAPDSTVLFDVLLFDQQLVLSQTGTYTLTVDGNGVDDVGVYAFRLLEVPGPQQFAIGVGDSVSDGVPASGAGNIESPGAVDIYTFEAITGQEAVFDRLSGSNVLLGWQLQAPDSTVLFDTLLQDQQLVLPQTGTYTLTVDGNGIDDVGVYSFRLLEVPGPQQFAIGVGDTISDGVPASGAGNIESPGAIDIYTFDASAGQELIFDRLSGSNVLLGWHLQAPDSTVLFDTLLQDQQLVLPQTGTYTLTVDGNAIDHVDLYSFRLLEVPAAPQQFGISIGDTVSDGVPAPGAGNIESPGALDIYTFDALAGQEAVFDRLSGNPVQLGWQLQSPDNTVLFDTVLGDQQLVLPQTGTYTLTVNGNSIDDVGLYSFRLLEAPAAPQQFAISIGDTVSDGVPASGAGNIESPGAVDIYTFDGLAGQEVTFDRLSGSNVLLGWQLQAPDNTVLFDTILQDQQLVLPQNGAYTLTVFGNDIDDFGNYSFTLLEVVTKYIYLPLVTR